MTGIYWTCPHCGGFRSAVPAGGICPACRFVRNADRVPDGAKWVRGTYPRPFANRDERDYLAADGLTYREIWIRGAGTRIQIFAFSPGESR